MDYQAAGCSFDTTLIYIKQMHHELVEVCRIGQHNCVVRSRRGDHTKSCCIPHGLYTLDVLWRCLTSLLEEMWDKIYAVVFIITRVDNCLWTITYKSDDDIHVDSELLGDVMTEICSVIDDSALHRQRIKVTKSLNTEHYRHCGLRVCRRDTSRHLCIYYRCPLAHGTVMYNIRRNPLHQYMIPSCNMDIIRHMDEYGEDSLMLLYFNSMCVAAGVRDWPDDLYTDHINDDGCKHNGQSSSYMIIVITLLIIITILFVLMARHST